MVFHSLGTDNHKAESPRGQFQSQDDLTRSTLPVTHNSILSEKHISQHGGRSVDVALKTTVYPSRKGLTFQK